MPKIYNNKNVYEAAMERFDIIFTEFNDYYFSVSGGKDSSIMLQLAARAARKHQKKFSVLFIDLEAQYKATINHILELIEDVRDVLDCWYWIALPLSLRNAVSILQPKWICWDKNDKKKWVRQLPNYHSTDKKVKIITETSNPWNWFEAGMEFEDFILYFSKWFQQRKGGLTAVGIAIRANESLNRFRTIISKEKEKFKTYSWTTRAHLHTEKLSVYHCFPLYDWKTEDDWIAVSKFNLKFNYIYELMYKNGLSIHEQRLCQPFGDDQKNGLNQFRALEPETWEKVLNRVAGVNFGNIYCRTSLLGNLHSNKPDNISWQQYTVFLLESIGLYAPELRDHYYKKIKTFFRWYEKQNIRVQDIKEEENYQLENARKVASWRRIARAIERNDFWMKRLSFSQTKTDTQRLFELKAKYKNLIYGDDTTDKDLKTIAEQLQQAPKTPPVTIRKFEGDYNRQEFYSLMGQFFAEKNYQKKLPYLYNDDKMIWCLCLDNKKNVLAFSSYTIKKSEINFKTDFYTDDIEYSNILLKYKLEQLENYKLPIITATCDTGIYNLLSQYNFHITRRTKNYIFLRREVEPYD